MNAFFPALLDPQAATPPGMIDPQNRPAGRRFDVYRNNVIVSLTDALATGFPVIHKLVGDEFFRAMAGVFVRAHPPRSAVLMTYGTEFPAFLTNFGPVSHLPYLPDVARLELALRESYHAADADPIDPAVLQSVDLGVSKLTFAPAMRLLGSKYPIHSIWQANTQPGAAPPVGGKQSVLITRPAYDPTPTVLPQPAARFLVALMKGDSVNAGLSAAGPELDLAATLTLLLQGRAITRIEEAA